MAFLLVQNQGSLDNIHIIILFSVFYTISSVCLTILLVKDDDKIRFDKLKLLKEIKLDFSSKEKDYLAEEKYRKDGKLKSRKTNLYGELTKILMNSITEI